MHCYMAFAATHPLKTAFVTVTDDSHIAKFKSGLFLHLLLLWAQLMPCDTFSLGGFRITKFIRLLSPFASLGAVCYVPLKHIPSFPEP